MQGEAMAYRRGKKKKKNGGRSERSNGNGKWDYVQAKGKDSDGEGNESIIYQEQRKKRAQEEVQHGCKVQMRDALKKNIKYFMQMGGISEPAGAVVVALANLSQDT